MAFQLFGTDHLTKGTTMYTPTNEDVATVRNAATLLNGLNGVSDLGTELHHLATRLERGIAQAHHARRVAAGMADEQRRLAETMDADRLNAGRIVVSEEAVADHSPNIVEVMQRYGVSGGPGGDVGVQLGGGNG